MTLVLHQQDTSQTPPHQATATAAAAASSVEPFNDVASNKGAAAGGDARPSEDRVDQLHSSLAFKAFLATRTNYDPPAFLKSILKI